MRFETLRQLFVHELIDLHCGEHKVQNALPAIVEAVEDGGLRRLLRQNLREVGQHIERLQTISGMVGVVLDSAPCPALAGLLQEALAAIEDASDPDLVDAGAIASWQRVAQYKIASYTLAKLYAEKLGLYEAADLFGACLAEEATTEIALTRIGDRRVTYAVLQ